MSKKYKNRVFEKVEIADLAAEGKAVTRIDNLVVFTRNNTVPGDVADIQITRQKRKYLEGTPIKFHKYSEKRDQPFCSHFGVCGGCKWQNLLYAEQLKYKENQVRDNLTRIGKIEDADFLPILAADKTRFYRNKLEYTFSNRRWLSKEEIDKRVEINDWDALGFHVPGMFDKVIDVEKCWLQNDPSNEIRLAVKNFALNNRYPFFDLKEHSGLLRNLIIRTTSTGQIMVVLAFFQNDKKEIKNILNYLKYTFPEIHSIMYVINPKANDSIADLDILSHFGSTFITEELDGLKFKIGPKSFFQTNTGQAKKLYRVVKDFAGLQGNEIVYDLYTGTGTIATYIARDAKQVFGIDNIKEAIDDAWENATANQIANTKFSVGDIKDVFTVEFMAQNGKPDLIIADPPRAGMHKNVIGSILFALPPKIVYVSCNPATQARDIELLGQSYKAVKIQPIDMFPHTHHVENVVLLEKV